MPWMGSPCTGFFQRGTGDHRAGGDNIPEATSGTSVVRIRIKDVIITVTVCDP